MHDVEREKSILYSIFLFDLFYEVIETQLESPLNP